MRITLLILVSLFTLPVFADWDQIDASEFSMKPPPKEGSTAYNRDFKILLSDQADRTEEECALGKSQTIPSFQTFFVNSGLLTKEESKRVRPVVEKAMKSAERVTNYFKNKFLRPRPYNESDEIHPCATKPAGAKAYPSSHAAMASVGACVLAAIFPTRADKFQSYGETLGLLRVKVGVHHPSDVESAQKLAAEICEKFSEDADFQGDVKSVQK